MNIGERIKALRTNKELTQEEFAQAVSVVRSHISLVEAGKREPSELMIKSIISAFPDISAQWLRTGEGDMYQPQSDKDQIVAMLGDLELPEITERFAVAYTSLSEQEQHVVSNYIRSVIADLVAKYHKEEAIHDEDAEPSFEERKRILIQELEDEEASGGKSSVSIGGEGTTA